MRVLANLACLIGLGIACLGGGCARNPYVLQGNLESMQQNYQQVASRLTQLQQSHQELDQENQRLVTLISQTEQREQLKQKELQLVREQLVQANDNVQQLREEKQLLATQVKDGKSPKYSQVIVSNSNLKDDLPPLPQPGVEATVVGDRVRVIIEADRLFKPYSAEFTPEGTNLLLAVSSALSRAYPEQLVEVQGHTDSQPLPRSSDFISNHHLSVIQAMKVYEQLVYRRVFTTQQLSVAAFGPNAPLASNAEEAGRQLNRRIQIMVLPNKIAR
ncbi:Hypothetical protein PBC10988_14630 [Planctomycetales bacterium 10988]|nr:Hypothetical protein PBC10988_14630 [Planctomycetales bacterium 10988]